MRHALVSIAGISVCLAGCTLRNSQLTTCQAEKEQLLTTIRTQRDTNRTLQTQVASLESRLDQSEKELARVSTGTRLSSVPSGANDPPRTTPVSSSTPSTIRNEGLPWRSPGSNSPSGGTEQQPKERDNRLGEINQGTGSTSLLALARRDRRLSYDPESHTAKVNLPVGFEDKSATITAEGKRQLDDLARLLKSDDARELRVMVAGFAAGKISQVSGKDGDDRFENPRQLGTARAQAVADYLDRHGIAQERLAVSGAGARSSDAANGVQVYLVEPDAPAVAWPEGRTIRR